MSKADAAQLISGIALGVMVLVLAIFGRRDLVAQNDGSYEIPNTSPGAPANAKTSIMVKAGAVIPRSQV